MLPLEGLRRKDRDAPRWVQIENLAGRDRTLRRLVKQNPLWQRSSRSGGTGLSNGHALTVKRTCPYYQTQRDVQH